MSGSHDGVADAGAAAKPSEAVAAAKTTRRRRRLMGPPSDVWMDADLSQATAPRSCLALKVMLAAAVQGARGDLPNETVSLAAIRLGYGIG